MTKEAGKKCESHLAQAHPRIAKYDRKVEKPSNQNIEICFQDFKI